MTVARQMAGTPAGGQFAASQRSEPDLTLTEYGDVTLAPGITEADRDRYTNRDCQQLAWALHEATGWPYAMASDLHDEDTDMVGWLHAGVMRPDGQVLDVEGPDSWQNMLEAYGDGSDAVDGDCWLEVEPTFARFGPSPDTEMTDDDKAHARQVAAALLTHFPTQETTT